MSGVTCNGEDLRDEAGAVDLLGREAREVPTMLSTALSSRCHFFPAGPSAGVIPHSDAVGEDTLNGASVEGAHNGAESLVRGQQSEDNYYLIDAVKTENKAETTHPTPELHSDSVVEKVVL